MTELAENILGILALLVMMYVITFVIMDVNIGKVLGKFLYEFTKDYCDIRIGVNCFDSVFCVGSVEHGGSTCFIISSSGQPYFLELEMGD